jgi:DNA modification methylase
MAEQFGMFDSIPELQDLKAPDTRAKLEQSYIVPPFSVLDTRQGYWQDRKRLWLSMGLKSEIGRGNNLLDVSAQSAGITDEKEIEEWNKQRTKKAKSYNIGLEGNSDNNWKLEDKKASGTSIFDPVLCELMYRWFCPENGKILDPFAGGSVRGIVANILGYKYTGIDLSIAQIVANKEQGLKLCPDNCPNWIQGDSSEIDKITDGNYYDMIFSCPPYHDLEQYTDDMADLSNMSWEAFKITYRKIIEKSIMKLANNRFACFVISEIRNERGSFKGFVPFTIDCFTNGGMHYYNEIILVNTVGSLSIRVAGQFANRKIGRTHQNILIFYKGDISKIQNHFKEIKQDINVKGEIIE